MVPAKGVVSPCRPQIQKGQDIWQRVETTAPVWPFEPSEPVDAPQRANRGSSRPIAKPCFQIIRCQPHCPSSTKRIKGNDLTGLPPETPAPVRLLRGGPGVDSTTYCDLRMPRDVSFAGGRRCRSIIEPAKSATRSSAMFELPGPAQVSARKTGFGLWVQTATRMAGLSGMGSPCGFKTRYPPRAPSPSIQLDFFPTGGCICFKVFGRPPLPTLLERAHSDPLFLSFFYILSD